MADFAGRTRRSAPELSLSDALFLAQNAAELEKLRAEWAEREAALDAKIALAGQADAIVTLRREAEADRERAAAAKAEAQRLGTRAAESAAGVARKAAEEAAAIVQAARDQAETIIAAAAETERHAAGMLGQAERVRDEVRAAGAVVAAREAELADASARLDAGRVALAEKAKRLRVAVESITAG